MCVCVLKASVPGGSVLLDMQLQPLTLAPRRSSFPYVVVLSLWTSGEAFRRDFQQVPGSWNSMTRSDVITWPIFPKKSSSQACISSKGPDIHLLLIHTGQLGLLGTEFWPGI